MTEQPQALAVDIVSDVVCPWCIIGYKQLERALALEGLSADIHWHPFELNPHMPEEGQNLREHLSEKYGTTPEDSVRARQRLTEMGAELGFIFAYEDDMRMFSTNRAHQLLHWADEKGGKHRLKLTLFEAYFSRREDVGHIDVLVDAAESVGLPASEAREILEDRRFEAEVREAESEWLARGVRGVPSMIFGQKHLVTGAQGVDTYRHLLRTVASGRAA